MEKVFKAFTLVLVVYFALASFFIIKPQPITKDAIDNAAAAYFVWQKNMVSYDGELLNYEREPLPIFLTATYVKFFTDIPQSISLLDFYQQPTYAGKILKINAAFAFFLILSIAWLGFQLMRSWLAVCLVVLGTWIYLIANPSYLNNLLTEILAALLVVLVSIFSYLLIVQKSRKNAFALGFLLGLFALTKALGLYIGLAMILLVALPLYWSKQYVKKILSLQLIACLAFCLTVAPWMARNYMHFGEFAIAQRGGIVLLVRALKNTMMPEEYRGAFYVYAPPNLQPLLARVFSYDPHALTSTGEYRRLMRRQPGDWQAEVYAKPEKAVSYFSKAFAIQQVIRVNLFAKKHPEVKKLNAASLMRIHQGRADFSMMQADQQVKSEAFKLIKANFVDHLKCTVLFAWRGLWSFAQGAWLINLLSFIALLAMPFLAVQQKRPEILAVSMLSILLIAFYAFFTHFLPRYSAPLIPIAVLALTYIAVTMLKKINWLKESV